ncbi:MAG: ATP-binding protein [Planctomycetes bacterium]|nr:ATP-binding protein [Planctomycetota bacterium]
MTGLPRFFVPPRSHYFLFGPRGTGKSTWLRQAYPDALWLDLLDPALERLLQTSPEALRERVDGQSQPGTVVLDEVQRAPAVLSVAHSLIEEKRPGLRFVFSGSSARKLRRTSVDLLGGRAARCAMHPFLAAELGATFELGSALRLGLVPGVLGASEPDRALRAYVALYLREEVKAEGMVRNLDSFGRFLEAMSFSQAATLNLANVARECQVSRTTVDSYLEVLEDLLLGYRVSTFQRRARRQTTSAPKFYWFDVGVYRSLRPTGPLDRGEEIEGAALEGLVAQHLRAWIDYSDAAVSLQFWRTRSGTEVDFVLYGEDTFLAIEVKNSRHVRPADLKSLAAFGEDYPEARRVLVYCGDARLRRQGVLCIPAAEFLAAVVPGQALPH